MEQSTIDTAKTIIEYPPAQVVALVFVSIQFIKQFLKEHNKKIYNTSLRAIAASIGGAGGYFLISQTVQGVIDGVILSGLTSVGYMLLSLFLNRTKAPEWQRKFSAWLASKEYKKIETSEDKEEEKKGE